MAFGVPATMVAASQGGGAPASENRRPNPVGAWEWWNDKAVQREVGLTPEKVASIDGFYRRRVKALKSVVDRYNREQATLDEMTKARVVDEATYSAQVLQFESLRSELNRSRMVMLYLIYQQLQPEQYSKLLDIFERNRQRLERERANRGRGSSAN
jgi:Spy/CpxP family protein refolding chaperone